MRTNIVLDEELVRKAFRFAPDMTKKDLVHLALEEFVQNHGRKDLRKLRGKIQFHKGYDYKALRMERR